MLSTPIGLGVSPGWTKTQATEPADHRTEKTCKQFDVSNSYSTTTYPGSVNKQQTKKECHRKVLKNVVDNICWMEPTAKLTATYQTRENIPSASHTGIFSIRHDRDLRIGFYTETDPVLGNITEKQVQATLKLEEVEQ